MIESKILLALIVIASILWLRIKSEPSIEGKFLSIILGGMAGHFFVRIFLN